MSKPDRTKKTVSTDATRSDSSRRKFMQSSSLLLAGGAVAGGLSVARAAHSFGSDTIRVGLIGCGGRGTGAVTQALSTVDGEVRLTAMGDLFEDRMQTAFRTIKSKHPDRVDVTRDTRFVGFDAYQKVLQADVDVVILATPPGFRPLHFEAAVDAGKHVFMEKPVATDAPGVRRVLAANAIAKHNGLAVSVGLQRHHEARYRQCVAQLHGGMIGDVIMSRAYWNGSGIWVRPRQQNDTELQYQCRNWYYFNWLCGDHITEQHVHNLDVINWVMDGFPVEAQGQGGRQVRTGDDTGQIFDHHFVEYTYDGGAKLISQCRHMKGCWNSVGEYVHGTRGYAIVNKAEIYDHQDNLIWKSDAAVEQGKGWQQQHHDLFAALRRGESPNEADYGAHSTMTAIMGRMATYGGKVVRWDDAIHSDIALADFDSLRSWDDVPPVLPADDGSYPVAVPGKTIVV
ncbi:Gfo/Idh/MocA family protein [Rosistilla oblonga]|uniref:Gfo/Idh/MocA family protein n=1 Tax=Rosistilla oblonga TaxID=2527990 RepID=UPI003A981454